MATGAGRGRGAGVFVAVTEGSGVGAATGSIDVWVSGPSSSTAAGVNSRRVAYLKEDNIPWLNPKPYNRHNAACSRRFTNSS